MMDIEVDSVERIKAASMPELPDGWSWRLLGSICERVSVGHVGPTSEFFCDPGEGVPLVRSQDVRPGKLMKNGVAHVTQAFHDKLKKSQLRAGDVLIVRVGANRGDCCVVPEDIGPLNCANIVFARPKEKNGFIGYFFQSPFGREMLLSATTGSAQGVINTSSVAAMLVPWPHPSIQRRIAGILSAYDELIANNQRRIAILEEMARALYREWFVHYRFPAEGAAKAGAPGLVMGEDGVPEGWEVKELAQLCSRMESGGTPLRSNPEFWEEGSIPWYKTKELWDSYLFEAEEAITPLAIQRTSAKVFQPGTILMAIYGSPTVGRMGIVTRESSCNL